MVRCDAAIAADRLHYRHGCVRHIIVRWISLLRCWMWLLMLLMLMLKGVVIIAILRCWCYRRVAAAAAHAQSVNIIHVCAVNVR